MQYKANDVTTITGQHFKDWIEQEGIEQDTVAEELGLDKNNMRNTCFQNKPFTYKFVRSILVSFPEFPVHIRKYSKISGIEFKKWTIDNEIKIQDIIKKLNQNIENKTKKNGESDLLKGTKKITKQKLEQDYFNKRFLNELQIKLILKCFPKFPKDNYTTNYSFYDFGFSTKFKFESAIKLFHFPDINTSREEYNIELERYFKELMRLVGKAKKEIVIYDYLVKDSNRAVRTETVFQKKQEEYLATILNHCKENEKLKYSRFLVLPKSYYNKSKENHLFQALSLLLYESYLHILDCYKYLNSRFSLCFCSQPPKPYSFGCIDDEFVIVELHKYKNNVAYPDKILIFDKKIEPDNEILSKMISYELSKVSEMIREARNTEKPYRLIKFDSLINAIKNAKSVLGNMLNQHQNRIETLRRKFENCSDAETRLGEQIESETNVLQDMNYEFSIIKNKLQATKNLETELSSLSYIKDKRIKGIKEYSKEKFKMQIGERLFTCYEKIKHSNGGDEFLYQDIIEEFLKIITDVD